MQRMWLEPTVTNVSMHMGTSIGRPCTEGYALTGEQTKQMAKQTAPRPVKRPYVQAGGWRAFVNRRTSCAALRRVEVTLTLDGGPLSADDRPVLRTGVVMRREPVIGRATHTRFLCYTHPERLVWDTPLP